MAETEVATDSQPAAQEQNAPAAKSPDGLRRHVRELSERNRGLVNSFSKGLDDISRAKAARAELNERTTGLRREKAGIYSRLDALNAELDAARKSADALRKDSKSDFKTLSAQLERLEWKLQTESTNPAKEREISTAIRNLERELPAAAKLDELGKGISVKMGEKRQLLSRLDAVRRELDEAAGKANAEHEKVIKLAAKADSLRKTISAGMDELSKTIGEKDRALEASAQTRRQQREEEGRQRHRIEAEEKKLLGERMGQIRLQALEIGAKLKSGKKITLEEMQILASAEQ
ncbi:hypothetical protein HY995_01850 [Candidatus Micrarchaeota archaeon]|nr:hypothetical protein [Candidatus Micrarchaeota archaeon]MBI5176810.1 hypothetical protein [Candidatus Micrarchaeota archaeon]